MSNKAQGDDFDVLTFFIIVMLVLTGIVGVFAYLLYNRVQKQSKKIQLELRNLDSMQDLAADKKFTNWVATERAGKVEQGPASEFNARIVQSSQSAGVHIDRLDPKPLIDRRSYKELPFSVTIKKGQLQNITKFLFDIEERWVGAKVKNLQLTWREKNKSWSCDVTISIFRSATQS